MRETTDLQNSERCFPVFVRMPSAKIYLALSSRAVILLGSDNNDIVTALNNQVREPKNDHHP